MYVNAIFGGWRPGGATCVSAAAVAVRGQTGSAGAGATQPRRSRRGGRGGAGGGGARRARGDRRDFAKGLFEGTFRRDFSKGLCEGTFKGFQHLQQDLVSVAGFSNRFLTFQTTSEGTFSSRRTLERRHARARGRRRRTAYRSPPGAGRDSRGDRERHGGHCGAGFGGQTQYTTRRTRLSQYLAACGVVYGRGGPQLS